MGLSSDEAAKWAGEEEFADFEVWPENWLIVEVFMAMSDQWIWTGGMESRRAGLNLCALPVVYEGLAISRKQRPEVFQGLQVMASAALGVMHSRILRE
ncbi:DUF1799 domain-containing protein [Massilia rhizosphaerae]|uniref:DUF1799 domain-containing protein n=1 Tax=Massilia rhizosphaerae TaxID=2784389 RepID=UPI0018DAFD95|nr:DUF1799 domain-containing protein [Massilia rhizosphaerae]